MLVLQIHKFPTRPKIDAQQPRGPPKQRNRQMQKKT